MKLRFRGAPVAALLLSLSWLSPTAHAETACESEAAQEYLPPLPRGCQKQRISAAGGMTFGVVQSPERLTRKAWEHQVIFFFGERYLDWEKAACKKVFCVQASFRARPLPLFRLPLRVGCGPGGAGGLEHPADTAGGGSRPEACRRAQDGSAATAVSEGGAQRAAAARAQAGAGAAGGEGGARHSAASRARPGTATVGGEGGARQSATASAKDGIAAAGGKGAI